VGLILIKMVGQSAEWPLAGYALAQFAAAIIVLPNIGYGRSFWPFDREIVDQALHYGIPIVIGGALGWVGLNASRFIVNDMLGVAAAGLFAVGYGFGQRAAAVATMLVTAAAFPLAVKSMEQNGSKVAMRQLADNSALLIAILAPSITGIYMLRAELVHLSIAHSFQQVTLAVLPLSALAGSIRSLRAHFVDQSFLLHGRTRLMIVVAAIDATATVLLSLIFIRYWGLVGAAGATVVAAFAAAIVSFTIGYGKFGLTLPLNHMVPVALATAAMAALLGNLPEATSFIVLSGHIAAGATTYVTVLVVLYAAPLLRMFRLRRQQSRP
jgi:O-antigen/teichoic acid export membrane protein